MEFPDCVIDNIVSSWSYSATQQVLKETSTISLPISKFLHEQGTKSSGKVRTFGKTNEEQKLSVAEPKTMIHPSRSSSLSYGRSASADPPYAQVPANSQVVFANGHFQDRPPPGAGSNLQVKTGLQELAGNRAQLYVLQRRILERIGKLLDWRIGWAAVTTTDQLRNEDMSDVDLEETEDFSGTATPPKNHLDVTRLTNGLYAADLIKAAASIDSFRESYEVIRTLPRLSSSDTNIFRAIVRQNRKALSCCWPNQGGRKHSW